jgi:flagellar hook-length control protein FliK
MALAQENKPDDPASKASDAVVATTKTGSSETSDTDTAQTIEANAAAPGLALPFSAVPAPVPSSELSSGLTFTSATRATQGLVAEAKPGALTTALNLATSAQLTSNPGIGKPGELETFDATVDPSPIRRELAPTPLASAPVLATQTPATTITARVGERGWDQGLGEKLVWMTSQKLQVAELRLNPADLGPLKITITLDQNQASAQFVSAHASVREAIESAMPRLREMLADSGITLGQASVGAETFRGQGQQHSDVHPDSAFAPVTNMGNVTMGERLLQHARGLVDTFA